MSESRKKNTLRNIVIALFSNVLIYVLSLFTSKVIKDHLGLQVLGLNGVLSNVISVLGLTEMGIGSAITFALYKPLAENNIELIKSIMSFYKKAYRIIALIVLGIGLVLFPFIPFIVKDENLSKEYIFLVYSLFLFNSVVSYLLVYKRTLIIADQKNYVITTISLIYTYVLRLSQLAIVFFTSNYVLYLLVQIVCTLLYNIIVCLICNKMYPYLKETCEKLPNETYTLIITKIKAVFYHSLGTVLVLGTDNILISIFCGLEESGRYNMYYSIVSMISTFVILIFDNMKDSIGNFLVSETVDSKRVLFKRLFFLNQSIVSICSVCLFVLLTPFIECLYGADTVIPACTVLGMVFSFYIARNGMTVSFFKSAAGLYEQDKYVPIVEGVVNIVVSIILAIPFGILGIVLGTVISYLFCPFWVQPKVVMKHIFNEGIREYFKNYSMYFLRTILFILIFYFGINKLIQFYPKNIGEFFIEALIVFIVTTLFWIVSVINKSEFRYFVKIGLKSLGKLNAK